MATVNTKSNIVTNLDATPKVMNSLAIMGGVLREQVATVEIAAADDNGSQYRMCRVHTSWRMSEITVFCDAITSGTDYDLGLYRTAADGGAVVDANCYADQITLATAILVGTQLLFEGSSAVGVEDIEQAVWQHAGYSSDPGYWLDLVFNSTVNGSGAGTVSLRVRYIANS